MASSTSGNLNCGPSADDHRPWSADGIRRLVVKIGSRSIVGRDGRLDARRIGSLAQQIARLRDRGIDVVLVSSGAVAAGLPVLGLSRRPGDLPTVQAAAAIGQSQLIEQYRCAFARWNIDVAQVLLTHPDLRSRQRHLNARNTLYCLLRAGMLPIVNENDTVSVEEIRFGDNDRLAALVAALVRADLLCLLTNVDGLLDHSTSQQRTVIPTVHAINEQVCQLIHHSDDAISRGGMQSKIEAAEIATSAGLPAVIANAQEDDVLQRIVDGEIIGTCFLPNSGSMRGRKRWIAFFDQPQGDLHVDEGAAEAITTRGGSLLAIGIRAVSRDFACGEPVRIIGPAGDEIARGLVNYSAEDIRRIAGRKSSELQAILGCVEYTEVIHRDNLALAPRRAGT